VMMWLPRNLGYDVRETERERERERERGRRLIWFRCSGVSYMFSSCSEVLVKVVIRVQQMNLTEIRVV
jgi:anti-anti-sigma regulatory factor